MAKVASKISARLSENLSEGLRDLGLNNGFDSLTNATSSGSGAGKYLDTATTQLTSDDATKQTRKLLESTRDREREEGLHRVLALMSKNRPVAAYFPLVTNCLSSHNLTIRALVSIYITRQAQLQPDLALMSVNMYQKDLNDSNPAIRAMALRVLSGMGLDSIAGLVVMSLKRSSRDGNWHVRKTVAGCLYKIYQMDSAHLGSLIDILNILLNDRSALVLGAAISAFNDLIPTRMDLLHPHYRHLCRSLIDADEWGQVALLRVLAKYARLNFVDPGKATKLDPDLELLLKSSEPLLQSRNPSVSMSVIRLIYHIAPSTSLNTTTKPLLRLLHSSPEMEQIVLNDIAVISQTHPSILSSHVSDFFVRTSDGLEVKRLKLRCLVNLAAKSNTAALLDEFQLYLKDSDDEFVAATVNAIAALATLQSTASDQCWQILLSLLHDPNSSTVSQAIVVISDLIQQMPSSSDSILSNQSRIRIINQLASLLYSDTIQSSTSRAAVYRLVGQYAEEGALETFAPDLLRLAAKNFANEDQDTKVEIVNLSAKLLTQTHQSSLSTHLGQLQLLYQYILMLARYDQNYTVRDRARFLKGLLNSAGISAESKLDVDGFNRGDENRNEDEDVEERRIFTVEQIKVLLLEAGKTEDSKLFPELEVGRFGSLALALDHEIAQPFFLPPWTTQPSDSALRSASSESRTASPSPRSLSSQKLSSLSTSRSGSSTPVLLTPSVSSSAIAGASARTKPKKTLDDFLASDEEEVEEIEEESNESSSEEDSDDSGSEEESSEEEEEQPRR